VRNGDTWGFHVCWNTAGIDHYLTILLFSLAVAAVYIMNQISDVEVDKKNVGMPLIARGIVSIRAAVAVLLFCALFSVFLLIVHRNIVAAGAGITALLLGYLYCFKPFRFSGKPVADFLSNAFGYGVIAFAVGWHSGGGKLFSIAFLDNALPYFLLMCAGSISSTLPDIEADRTDGKNTTAVVFGSVPSHILATGFLVAAAGAGYAVNDRIAMVCAAASFPFYILFLVKRNALFMEATYKVGGGLCMIAAFFSMPFFIPAAGVVFFSTWVYFKIRHGILYPSLLPVKQDENQ
jgi:4-hydroxybenzoate polyprenyltransferase